MLIDLGEAIKEFNKDESIDINSEYTEQYGYTIDLKVTNKSNAIIDNDTELPNFYGFNGVIIYGNDLKTLMINTEVSNMHIVDSDKLENLIINSSATINDLVQLIDKNTVSNLKVLTIENELSNADIVTLFNRNPKLELVKHGEKYADLEQVNKIKEHLLRDEI